MRGLAIFTAMLLAANVVPLAGAGPVELIPELERVELCLSDGGPTIGCKLSRCLRDRMNECVRIWDLLPLP